MGGRGAGSTANWRAQLRQMASQGVAPTAVTGSREQQAQFLEYFDSLYPMPTIRTYRIDDTGDGVMVQFADSTKRATYPSGAQASEAERRGTLKMLLYAAQQRQRRTDG